MDRKLPKDDGYEGQKSQKFSWAEFKVLYIYYGCPTIQVIPIYGVYRLSENSWLIIIMIPSKENHIS